MARLMCIRLDRLVLLVFSPVCFVLSACAAAGRFLFFCCFFILCVFVCCLFCFLFFGCAACVCVVRVWVVCVCLLCCLCVLCGCCVVLCCVVLCLCVCAFCEVVRVAASCFAVGLLAAACFACLFRLFSFLFVLLCCFVCLPLLSVTYNIHDVPDYCLSIATM